MGITRGGTDLVEELRLPAGGSFIITDHLGTELFRVTAAGNEVKVGGEAITAGGGSLTVDNTVDTPEEVTTLVAPGAVLVGGEATLAAVVSDTEPATSYPGLFWVQSDPDGNASSWQLFVRDAADSVWKEVGVADGLSAAPRLVTVWDADDRLTEFGATGSLIYLRRSEAVTGNIFGEVRIGASDSFLAHNVEGNEVSAIHLTADGASIVGNASFAGMAGFNGAVPSRPEVPATPTEQDIVDALVALGLVTQAAP